MERPIVKIIDRTPRNSWAINGCAAFAVVLGLITLIGWGLNIPALLRLQPGWTPMVVNTGLGFVLSGTGLWLANSSDRRGVSLAALLGILVVALGVEELVVLIFNLSPAFSLPELHRSLQPDYSHPGRVAPNTAICFLLFGIGLIASPKLKNAWTSSCLFAIAVIVSTIGLFGVLGYELKLEYLYEWTGVVRMAVHTGVGIVILGLGMGALVGARQRADGPSSNKEVRTVFRTAAILLLLTASSAGVASFAFLQVQVERQQHEQLQQMSNDRIALVGLEIANRSAGADVVTNYIELTADIRALCTAPSGIGPATSLRDWASNLSLTGFSYAAVDAGSRHLVLSGSPAIPQLTVSIAGSAPGELLWDQGFILRRTLPICKAFHTQGTLVTEQRLASTTESHEVTNRFGSTTEMALCAPDGQFTHCFPVRSRPHPFTAPRKAVGVPIPMDYALKGQTGTIVAMDYRQHRVLAGYGPIGDTGIGLVVKCDIAEIYAPIREQFQRILFFLVVLLPLALLVLQRRLVPLLSTLDRTRSQAQLGLARSEAAMESNMDGFFVMECVRDKKGHIKDMRYTMMNAAGAALWSRPRSELIGRGMCEMLPELCSDGLLAACVGVVETGESIVVDRRSFLSEMRWYHMQLVKLEDGITMTVRDITSAHQASEIIRHQAQHDALTGAVNRAGFEVMLSAALAAAKQSDQMFGVALLDLDHFKSINDRMGHAAGDQLLVQAVARIKSSLRPTDTLARMGGDEFVVLLPNIPNLPYPEGPEIVAKKLVSQFALPFILDEHPTAVSISLGMSVYPKDGTEPDQLLRAADEAMYEAKRQGRNRYVLSAGLLGTSK
jgi:diguanylate cyclase (GGDEF)-like protein